MDVRLEPIAPAHSPTQKQGGNTTANAFGLETIKDEPEQPTQLVDKIINLVSNYSTPFCRPNEPEETPLAITVTAGMENNSPVSIMHCF